MHYLLAVVLVLATTISSLAERRVALVIGNNSYQKLSLLRNPVLDAKRLAEILAGNGFDVMSCDGEKPGCFDLSRTNLIDALDLFRRKSKGADVALVFYAGHGMQTKEQGNIIAPIDIEMSCEADDPYRSVVLDDVLRSVRGAKEKIVILDACRNDPLKTLQCASDRGAKTLAFGSISVSDAERKFLLMTSTLNGQLARDGLPGTHSPFAEALFHYLEQEPAVHFDQLLDQVAIRVEARARDQGFIQVPEILIRGGAPKSCLSGKNCSGDPEAAKLRLEVETLKAENARGGEFQEIVHVMVRESGYSSLDEIPIEERKSLFKGIVEASRALVQRGDDKGEQALAALKEGNEETAIRLFEEDIARRLASVADENREAAASARHVASLARPTNVARAAEFYAKASELEPDDLQTWMDLGSTMRDSGQRRQSASAFKSAIERASKVGDRLWEARFNNELGRTVYLTGQEPLLAVQLYHERAIELASEQLILEQSHDGKSVLLEGQYRLCEVKVELGDTDRAEQSCRSAVSIARNLAETDPENPVWQRDLSVSLGKLGDVLLMQGNLAAAQSSYQDDLVIAERLAAADLGNVARQRDLSVSYVKVGNVQMAQRHIAAALTAYQNGLAIAEQLATSDPNNVEWQRDLSVHHNNVGDVQVAQGDNAAALSSYQDSLAIIERLAASDPNNAGWQRDLTVSYDKVGDVQVYQGDPPAALSSYQDSLAIRERLAASDPDNVGWRRDLTVSYDKVGGVQVAQGNLAAALTSHEKGLAIAEQLTKSDPGNAVWQRDLSVSYERVGDVQFAQGDLAAALKSYENSLVIREQWANSHPDNTSWQWELFLAYSRLADYTNRKEEFFSKAVELLERLHAKDRLAPSRLIWIEITKNRLAIVRERK